MMNWKRMGSALLAAALLVALAAGCNGNADPTPEPTSTPVEPTPAEKTEVNFAVLSGPTGVGAAKLLADNDAGTTANHYNVTIAAQNEELTGKLTSGDLDIAALATNVAANLYQKSNGAIQIAALNTLGVLYVLENGDSISSVADLAGKTIYTTGQGANPEFVLNYILQQNGLTPGEDVTIEFKTAEEVSAMMIGGQAEVCMMPVPAATTILSKNADVRKALDITQEWDKVAEQGVLTMGCIVVRTAFAQEHPEAVNAFLEEYAASIDYVKENVAEASELVAQYGITGSAAIAQQAIPDCNLVCITGESVREEIAEYYEMLYAANPDSIGGAMPDDAFYYIP